MHAYEVRPRKYKRGVDLISDVLPFGALWYVGQMPSRMQIGYTAVAHMMPWFAFTMTLAT